MLVHNLIFYPGGKRDFYEHMKPYFPRDMRIFVEPFFGGGSTSLGVLSDPDFNKLEGVVASELAPEVFSLWKGVRDYPNEVIETIDQFWRSYCPHVIEANTFNGVVTPHTKALGNIDEYLSKLSDEEYNKSELKYQLQVYEQAVEEGKRFWEWATTVDTSTLNLVQRATRTYLINRTSFSGLGDSGSMSRVKLVQFSLSKPVEDIPYTSNLLQRVEIFNQSYTETFKWVNENPNGVFVFLDPPYFKQEGSGLYGRNGDTHLGFNHEEFARLTKELKAPWFVTYDDSIKVRKMFEGCHIKNFRLPRGYTLAGKTAENALDGEELFIANFKLETDSFDNMSLL